MHFQLGKHVRIKSDFYKKIIQLLKQKFSSWSVELNKLQSYLYEYINPTEQVSSYHNIPFIFVLDSQI